MLRLYVIILTCLTLLGCANATASKNIDSELLSQGEIYAQQLYKVVSDVDYLNNINGEEISKFYNQDKTYLNANETEFIKVIENMLIDATVLHASHYAENEDLYKEVKGKLKHHKNTLENEYGITVD